MPRIVSLFSWYLLETDPLHGGTWGVAISTNYNVFYMQKITETEKLKVSNKCHWELYYVWRAQRAIQRRDFFVWKVHLLTCLACWIILQFCQEELSSLSSNSSSIAGSPEELLQLLLLKFNLCLLKYLQLVKLCHWGKSDRNFLLNSWIIIVTT